MTAISNPVDLHEQIVLAQQILADRKRGAEEYQRLTKRLGMNVSLTVEALTANQQLAREQLATQRELLHEQKRCTFLRDAGE